MALGALHSYICYVPRNLMGFKGSWNHDWVWRVTQSPTLALFPGELRICSLMVVFLRQEQQWSIPYQHDSALFFGKNTHCFDICLILFLTIVAPHLPWG